MDMLPMFSGRAKISDKEKFEKEFFEAIGSEPYGGAFEWDGDEIVDINFVYGDVLYDEYMEELCKRLKPLIIDGEIEFEQKWVEEWFGITTLKITKDKCIFEVKSCEGDENEIIEW